MSRVNSNDPIVTVKKKPPPMLFLVFPQLSTLALARSGILVDWSVSQRESVVWLARVVRLRGHRFAVQLRACAVARRETSHQADSRAQRTGAAKRGREGLARAPGANRATRTSAERTSLHRGEVTVALIVSFVHFILNFGFQSISISLGCSTCRTSARCEVAKAWTQSRRHQRGRPPRPRHHRLERIKKGGVESCSIYIYIDDVLYTYIYRAFIEYKIN